MTDEIDAKLRELYGIGGATPATTTTLHYLDMDPMSGSINLVYPTRKVRASARVRSPPSNQRPLFY